MYHFLIRIVYDTIKKPEVAFAEVNGKLNWFEENLKN